MPSHRCCSVCSHVVRSASGSWIVIALLASSFSVFGQTRACPSISPPTAPTAADKAYGEARYADAESLYTEAMVQRPNDPALAVALVRTLLQEGKVQEASAQVSRIPPDQANSASVLTALAEVQMRQGTPWAAAKSLDTALTLDPCYARSHLIRSRLLRLNSMYASERAEIQRAYEIDPADPEIQRAWSEIVSAASEAQGIEQSLAATDSLDAKSRQTAETSLHALMSHLSETSQTCQVLPSTAAADIPLQASLEDKKRHIYRYHLEAQFPQGKGTLLVDTAASGIYISQSLAALNNFHPATGAPPNTVHVDELSIGPLTFRDCTVGVSNTPFPDKADGLIGTDMFQSYLTTLNFPAKRISLAPLPALQKQLPGDRPAAPELAHFIPVYHRHNYLLLPVTVNNSAQGLFLLGSGMSYTAMAPEIAHSVSHLKMEFTYTVESTSGAKDVFYRDTFALQFADQPPINHLHAVNYDLSGINRNAGFQIAGILGLDVLNSQIIHLDYRDGLMKLELVKPPPAPTHFNSVGTSIDMNGGD